MTEWTSPGITADLFDSLLDDVLKTVVEKALETDWRVLPQSVHMAMWDSENFNRSWGSVDIVSNEGDTNNYPAILGAIGRLAVSNGQIPVAAYWCKNAKMESTASPDQYTGFIIIGMTDDNRINGAFLAIGEDGKPIGAQMWHFATADDGNTIDSDVLDNLFIAAKEAYREILGDPDKPTSRETLTSDLFKNVKGIGGKHNKDENKDNGPKTTDA